MGRRGKKLLRLGTIAAVSDVEGGLAAAVTLSKTGNTWPIDGDGAGTRGERGAGVCIGGKREGKKLLQT